MTPKGGKKKREQRKEAEGERDQGTKNRVKRREKTRARKGDNKETDRREGRPSKQGDFASAT